MEIRAVVALRAVDAIDFFSARDRLRFLIRGARTRPGAAADTDRRENYEDPRTQRSHYGLSFVWPMTLMFSRCVGPSPTTTSAWI